MRQHGDIRTLADKAAIQLNDTHPAIAVAELMRTPGRSARVCPWDEAWRITTATISYTNHTLLPEALESWPVSLMERLLPRHMQIVYQINRLHLDASARMARTDGTAARGAVADRRQRRPARAHELARLPRVAQGEWRLRAAHRTDAPDRVPRSAPALSRTASSTRPTASHCAAGCSRPTRGSTSLLTDVVGEQVLDDADALDDFADVADDAAVHERLRRDPPRQQAGAGAAGGRAGWASGWIPIALFDVQIKRIHEYKRQLLNILETIALYNEMRARPTHNWVPRVKIFAGKAAASYQRAKLIIKLINDVARVINNDPAVRGLLKVVFMPDYNVSLAEVIIPAADLSEQISTAGMEASGTGNMKLALNGALTIGTLDGANVEIRERVGDDNIFIFGLTAEEVSSAADADRAHARRSPASPVLREVLDAIGHGVFSPDEPQRFRELVDELTGNDHFLVTADFERLCRDAAAGCRRVGMTGRAGGAPAC